MCAHYNRALVEQLQTTLLCSILITILALTYCRHITPAYFTHNAPLVLQPEIFADGEQFIYNSQVFSAH